MENGKITSLYHHSSIDFLETYLEKGLKGKSPYQYDRAKWEDDYEQMIFFTYAIQGEDSEIIMTDYRTMSKRTIMYVLDYNKISEDYAKGKLGDVEINIYDDYRNFNDGLVPIWSEGRDYPAPLEAEIIIELGFHDDVENGHLYFPMHKYLECIYTTQGNEGYVRSAIREHNKAVGDKYKYKIKVYSVPKKYTRKNVGYKEHMSMLTYKDLKCICSDKSKSKKELIALSKKYNLPCYGTKKDLCRRLMHLIHF